MGGNLSKREHQIMDLVCSDKETIDRVARAICRTSSWGGDSWDTLDTARQITFRHDARAVLAALRDRP